jgi:hypothetical protein
MVRKCGHCGKKRVLVGVVRSEFYTMSVCTPCAIVAARLVSQLPRGDGPIEIVSLENEGPYTQWLQRISRN